MRGGGPLDRSVGDRLSRRRVARVKRPPVGEPLLRAARDQVPSPRVEGRIRLACRLSESVLSCPRQTITKCVMWAIQKCKGGPGKQGGITQTSWGQRLRVDRSSFCQYIAYLERKLTTHRLEIAGTRVRYFRGNGMHGLGGYAPRLSEGAFRFARTRP